MPSDMSPRRLWLQAQSNEKQRAMKKIEVVAPPERKIFSLNWRTVARFVSGRTRRISVRNTTSKGPNSNCVSVEQALPLCLCSSARQRALKRQDVGIVPPSSGGAFDSDTHPSVRLSTHAHVCFRCTQVVTRMRRPLHFVSSVHSGTNTQHGKPETMTCHLFFRPVYFPGRHISRGGTYCAFST